MVLAQPQMTPASALNARPVTLAVIVGNRGFFPAHLAGEGRTIILEILEKAGIRAIITPAGKDISDATRIWPKAPGRTSLRMVA